MFEIKICGKGCGIDRYQVQGDRGRVRSFRGYSCYGATTKHNGMCIDIGNNVFEYRKNHQQVK